MIASLLATVGPWIGALVAGALALFGVYKAGHSAGKSQANAENAQVNANVEVAAAQKQAQDATQQLQTVQTIQNENANLDANAIADRLQQYADPASGNDSSKVQG